MTDNHFWDNRYTQSPDLYGAAPNQYFQEKINQLRPGRLLIPGEGEGRQAVYAAQQGWQVTAIDASKVAVRHALQKAEGLGLQLSYHHSKAEEFHYGKAYYDATALIFFHLHPASRVEAHGKVAASVKPGGYLMVEGFHPRQLDYSSGGPKKEEMLYTREMLVHDFEDWEVLESLEGEVSLREGSGHAGTGYITRLLARKRL